MAETKKKTANKKVTSSVKTNKNTATKKSVNTPKKITKAEVKENVKKIDEIEIISAKKESTKDNKKNNKNLYYVLVGILIIIAIIIIIFLLYKGDNSAIDRNSPTYEGKKITEVNGNTVIEEENKSRTIESKAQKSKYIKATDDLKKEFAISNVKVENNETYTIVTGKIKNIKSGYKNVYVNIKFYQAGEVAGSSSTLIKDLTKNKTADFKIKTMGNFVSFKYEVTVEYVG